MRAAVTGASGAMGSALMARLVKDGHDALGVARDAMLPEVDVVFHLAGSAGIAASLEDPLEDLAANTGETLRRLEELRLAGATPVLVLASSCAVYGPTDAVVTEAMAPAPRSPYGASKAAAELAVAAYAATGGIRGRVARIANAFGPGLRRLVVYELARRALDDGAPLRVRGTGTEIRDLISLEDAARALILIATAPDGPGGSGEVGIYNVGSGEPVTIRGVAEMIAVEAGLAATDVVFEGTGEPSKVDTFVPNVDRLRALGFAPSRELRGGIRDTVGWVRGER